MRRPCREPESRGRDTPPLPQLATEVDFRIVQHQQGVQPLSTIVHRVPEEMVELSSGTLGIDAFLDQIKQQQQQQSPGPPP